MAPKKTEEKKFSSVFYFVFILIYLKKRLKLKEKKNYRTEEET